MHFSESGKVDISVNDLTDEDSTDVEKMVDEELRSEEEKQQWPSPNSQEKVDEEKVGVGQATCYCKFCYIIHKIVACISLKVSTSGAYQMTERTESS